MAITRLLNPRNDLAFKRIFGTERNKDILIGFLNEILGPKRHAVIRDVTLIQTDLMPEIDALRESAVDVMCTDDQGNRFIVEMQVEREAGFEKRVQYYAAKAYIEQRHVPVGSEDKKKSSYGDLKEVIFIAILDHVLFPHKQDYTSHHVMLDQKTHDHDLKDFSFHFIELDKFTKEAHLLKSMEDRWLYFLKHGEDLTPEELQELICNAPMMKRVVDEMNRVNWSVEQLRAYDSVEKRIWSHHGTLKAAHEDGKEEGMVKAFSEMGLSEEAIAQKLNMSVDQIRSIIKRSAR